MYLKKILRMFNVKGTKKERKSRIFTAKTKYSLKNDTKKSHCIKKLHV